MLGFGWDSLYLRSVLLLRPSVHDSFIFLAEMAKKILLIYIKIKTNFKKGFFGGVITWGKVMWLTIEICRSRSTNVSALTSVSRVRFFETFCPILLKSSFSSE